MSIPKLLSIAFIAMFLTACAASLEIFDSSNNSVKGVPFRAPALYVFSGDFTMYSKDTKDPNEEKNCVDAPFFEIHSLPLGEQYYANVETALLAKSEFSIQFAEQGTLKEIALNSDTTVDDVASGVTKLLSITSPIPGGGSMKSHLFQNRKPPCDTGKIVKVVQTFEDFKNARQRD